MTYCDECAADYEASCPYHDDDGEDCPDCGAEESVFLVHGGPAPDDGDIGQCEVCGAEYPS